MTQPTTGNIIDKEQCIKCQLCIEVCPCNIIGANTHRDISFLQERTPICLNCGHCMAICSSKAIKVNGLEYGKDIVDAKENSVNYRDFIGFISNRRSIRNYKETSVSKEVIQSILDSVSYAPFGSEPEKVSIAVTNNRVTIKSALPHIEKFLEDIVNWIENPIASQMIKRKRGLETFNTIKNHLYPISKLENYKLKYGDRITRGAPAILIFHAEKGAEEHTNNSIIYASYVMLAAHSAGLGASMVGIVPAAINKVKEVREIFEIPKEHEAVISVILGYPKYRFKRTIKRNVQAIHWVD